MDNWNDVWSRLSQGQHAVICGVGPIPEPDPAELRLTWVDCEAHPEPFGMLEEATRRIDHELGVNPWVDLAAQHLRSALRRRLLGDDPRELELERYERSLRRPVPPGPGPRPALLLSGLERADRASLERLTHAWAGEHPPAWPLLLRFDGREPSGAARALLQQLERVLPQSAFWWGPPSAGWHEGASATLADTLTQLSSEALRVLRAAATIGDRFEVETVAQLLEIDELTVLDAIQQALDHGLPLEDRGRGVFRFGAPAAAALRQATLPALARAWHWRLAELFGGLPAPPLAQTPARKPPAPAATTPAATTPAAPAPAAPAPARTERRAPSAAPSEREPTDSRRAAAHAEAAGFHDDAGEHYLSVASDAALAGRYAQALDAASRALALAGRVPEPQGRLLAARALLVIGQCRWLARGPEPAPLEQAIDALEQARDLLSDAGHPELLAELAATLASVWYDIGTPQALERALVEITRASHLWLDAGRPVDAARLLNDEAAIWVKLGNPVRANELLSRSREVFGNMAAAHPEARLELLETEHLLARLMLRVAARPDVEREALQLGVQHALAAEDGYRALGDRRQLCRVWETLGRLELKLGQLDVSAERLRRARALQLELGDVLGAARSSAALSDVLAQSGDYAHALESLAEAASLNSEKGSGAGLQHDLASLRELQAHLPESLTEPARQLGLRIVRALGVA